MYFFFQLCQLTHGNLCSGMVHRDANRQSIGKSFPAAFSKGSHLTTELVTFYQFGDQFQNADHVVAFTIWCTVSEENHLFIRRVLKLQSQQPVRCPPVTRWPARSTPPTAHVLFFFLSLAPWLVDTEHKKSYNAHNLQCSQTPVNVMTPRASCSPATCPRKQVLFHMICFV